MADSLGSETVLNIPTEYEQGMTQNVVSVDRLASSTSGVDAFPIRALGAAGVRDCLGDFLGFLIRKEAYVDETSS